jgi:hypothetical protein
MLSGRGKGVEWGKDNYNSRFEISDWRLEVGKLKVEKGRGKREIGKLKMENTNKRFFTSTERRGRVSSLFFGAPGGGSDYAREAEKAEDRYHPDHHESHHKPPPNPTSQ